MEWELKGGGASEDPLSHCAHMDGHIWDSPGLDIRLCDWEADIMKIQMDVIVDDFSAVISKCFLPIIVIYQKPKDYPEKYVARLWDVNNPTEYAAVKGSLEEIRAVVPRMMVRFPLSKLDDPRIIETYL